VSQVPQPDGSLIPFPHFYERGKPGCISVDRRGRRFVNQSKSYHVYIPALIEACRDTAMIEAWIVCDHPAIRRFGLSALGPAPMPMRAFLSLGYIKRANSPRAPGACFGIDADELDRTLRVFNASARHGQDPQFQRGDEAADNVPNPCVAPLQPPPFYAVRIVAGELGTFAGIATNAHAQVIDGDGAALAGLHAVGNDAASVMGGTYPGAGITIGPAMTFGYIAVRHLAASRKGARSVPTRPPVPAQPASSASSSPVASS